MKKLYFAHPCYTQEEKRFKEAFIEAVNKSLENASLGKEFAIIDPFDYMPNVEQNAPLKRNISRSVKEVRVRILRESDVIIALADGADAGVAFEAGIADTCLIPMILVANKMEMSRASSMLLGSATAIIDDIMEPGKIDLMLDIVMGLLLLDKD